MYFTDKRWKQLGDVLVHYSAEVKPGHRIMIAMGELESFPLVHAVYEASIKAGAFPQVQFLSETLRRSVLKYGTSEQLRWVPEIEAYGMEWADVYFGLRGAYNLYEIRHDRYICYRIKIDQTAFRGREVGLWLRIHSRPDAVLATNTAGSALTSPNPM